MALAVLTNLMLRMTISWGSIIIILVLQRENLKPCPGLRLGPSAFRDLSLPTMIHQSEPMQLQPETEGEEMPAGLFPHTSMDP